MSADIEEHRAEGVRASLCHTALVLGLSGPAGQHTEAYNCTHKEQVGSTEEGSQDGEQAEGDRTGECVQTYTAALCVCESVCVYVYELTLRSNTQS